MSKYANFHGIQAVALHEQQIEYLVAPKLPSTVVLAGLLIAQALLLSSVISYQIAVQTDAISEDFGQLITALFVVKNVTDYILNSVNNGNRLTESIFIKEGGWGEFMRNDSDLILQAIYANGNQTAKIFNDEEEPWVTAVKDDLDEILKELQDEAFKRKVIAAIEETEFSMEVGTLELSELSAGSQVAAELLLDACEYDPIGVGPINCNGGEFAGVTSVDSSAEGLSAQSVYLSAVEPPAPASP